MAEKQAGRPKTTTGRDGRLTIAVYKGSSEYADWLRTVAKKDRIGLTDVIDQAIAEWAAKRNYSEPPARLGEVIGDNA